MWSTSDIWKYISLFESTFNNSFYNGVVSQNNTYRKKHIYTHTHTKIVKIQLAVGRYMHNCPNANLQIHNQWFTSLTIHENPSLRIINFFQESVDSFLHSPCANGGHYVYVYPQSWRVLTVHCEHFFKCQHFCKGCVLHTTSPYSHSEYYFIKKPNMFHTQTVYCAKHLHLIWLSTPYGNRIQLSTFSTVN